MAAEGLRARFWEGDLRAGPWAWPPSKVTAAVTGSKEGSKTTFREGSQNVLDPPRHQGGSRQVVREGGLANRCVTRGRSCC
jgi:hypothetical protein